MAPPPYHYSFKRNGQYAPHPWLSSKRHDRHRRDKGGKFGAFAGIAGVFGDIVGDISSGQYRSVHPRFDGRRDYEECEGQGTDSHYNYDTRDYVFGDHFKGGKLWKEPACDAPRKKRSRRDYEEERYEEEREDTRSRGRHEAEELREELQEELHELFGEDFKELGRKLQPKLKELAAFAKEHGAGLQRAMRRGPKAVKAYMNGLPEETREDLDKLFKDIGKELGPFMEKNGQKFIGLLREYEEMFEERSRPSSRSPSSRSSPGSSYSEGDLISGDWGMANFLKHIINYMASVVGGVGNQIAAWWNSGDSTTMVADSGGDPNLSKTSYTENTRTPPASKDDGMALMANLIEESRGPTTVSYSGDSGSEPEAQNVPYASTPRTREITG